MVVGVTLCSWRRGPMELRLGARAEGDDQLLVVRAPPLRRLFHRLCVESCNVLLEVAVVLLQLGRAHRECPGVVRRLCARQDNRVDERGHVARRLETVSTGKLACRKTCATGKERVSARKDGCYDVAMGDVELDEGPVSIILSYLHKEDHEN